MISLDYPGSVRWQHLTRITFKSRLSDGRNTKMIICMDQLAMLPVIAREGHQVSSEAFVNIKLTETFSSKLNAYSVSIRYS